LPSAVFEHFRGELDAPPRQSSSGKELIDGGFERDIDLAAEFDVSANVPRLAGRCFGSS
jgi:2-phosphosulfolactate phosphatase